MLRSTNKSFERFNRFDSPSKHLKVMLSNLVKKTLSTAQLKDIYKTAKALCVSKKLPRDVNPAGVFACNELALREISVYGFDYDYTLACYKPAMDFLLFNLGKEALVKKFMYPKEILDLKFNQDFTIRGLHYDIENGLVLKLDSFLQIQLGTVYKGLKQLPDEKVIELYKNKVIPIAHVEAKDKDLGGRGKLYQLADLFSRPEMSLLCSIVDYFEENSIDYHPKIVFQDLRSVKVIPRPIPVERFPTPVPGGDPDHPIRFQNAIGTIHPVMHNEVVQNTRKYLEENLEIRKLMTKLRNAGKHLFLITNSPFEFVNSGMSLVIGPDWKEFFDIVIVEARKPKFFTDQSTPIRIFDENSKTHLWDRVTKLEKGVVYCEGTVKQLKEMTGWIGNEVLYFGDHPYSDLADVTLEHGWRTGAIIHELIHEINTLNNPSFKVESNWLQVLTQAIEEHEDLAEDEEAAEEIKRWTEERNQLLQSTKRVFNPQFGSVFRTYNNPTYFSRRLFRFADIYTSELTNLLNYSLNHKFFPRRGALPHEYASMFM